MYFVNRAFHHGLVGSRQNMRRSHIERGQGCGPIVQSGRQSFVTVRIWSMGSIQQLRNMGPYENKKATSDSRETNCIDLRENCVLFLLRALKEARAEMLCMLPFRGLAIDRLCGLGMHTIRLRFFTTKV